MAVIECTNCGLKALKLAQRTECPACSVPYQSSAASQEEEEYIPEESVTPFQATILEIMDTLLSLKSWEEIRDVIEQQQQLLLSPECIAYLREVSARHWQEANATYAEPTDDMYLDEVSPAQRQEANATIAEHIDMYLDIFEDAMRHDHNVEIAWQHFQSRLDKLPQAWLDLIVTMAKGDIRPALEKRQDGLLSAASLATLHRAIALAGADKTDAGRSYQLFLRILSEAREGRTPEPTQLQEMLQELVNARRKDGKLTIMPGMPGVDPNDPHIAELTQEINTAPKDIKDLFIDFCAEIMRTLEPDIGGQLAPQLQETNIPHIHELYAQLFARISHEQQPHLWEMLRLSQESFDLYTSDPSSPPASSQNEPPAIYTLPEQKARHIALIALERYRRGMVEEGQDVEQAIADFTEALSFFTYEKNPLEWSICLGARAGAYMHRRVGEPKKNIELALADFDTALDSLEREEYIAHWAWTALYRSITCMRLFELTYERRLLERVIADTTRVLPIFTRENGTEEWAAALQIRGLAYVERKEGDQEQNVMRALADFAAAEVVLTREDRPDDWAMLQLNIGNAYLRLFAEDHNKSIEQALKHFNAALSVFKRETTPDKWALAIVNQGMAYSALTTGDRKQNQERALAGIEAALKVFEEQRSLIDLGKGYLNRGNIYLQYIGGERRDNREKAAEDYTEALKIFTKEQAPVIHATICINRGMAYQNLAIPDIPALEHDKVSFVEMFNRFLVTSGPVPFLGTYIPYITEHQRFAKMALADFNAALAILTPEDNPQEWAQACRAKATLGYGLLDFGSYEPQAADYFDKALSVFTRQGAPLEWATTLNNRATYYLHLVLNGRKKYAGQVIGDAKASLTVFQRESAPVFYRSSQYMIARASIALQRWQEAHEAFLNVRAVQRDLVTTAINNANQFDLIAEFSFLDIYLNDAQVLIHLQKPEEAALALEEGRAQSLRGAFALDTLKPERISDPSARQRAVDFLTKLDIWRALRRKAGEALEHNSPASNERSQALEDTYNALLEASAEIRIHDNPDFMASEATLQTIGRAIVAPDEALVYLATGLLDGEKRGMALIVTPGAGPAPQVLHIALPRLTREAIADLFTPDAQVKEIPITVNNALHTLGDLGLSDVARALLDRKIHTVRLVAYGHLGLFPLPATYVTLPKGRKQPLGDVFEVTIVPSARAAEIARERLQTQREDLLMVGNPQPLSDGWHNLRYAAAEAEASYHIARRYGYRPATIRYLLPEEAKKQRLIEELQRARYAQLAMHATYNVADPQRSQLILAGRESIPEAERTISLDEALDGSVNLIGLRLLVLSACESSVFDIRRAPNEVVGLAAGFLQAGAAGVIASLWKVSEGATYLLMSRFAEFYLNPSTRLSPAQALARAQRWLREEATNRVLQSYRPAFVDELSGMHKNLLLRLQTDAAARAQKEPDACMYADPEHWAAFVVTGR
jgi:CHAT domain-containing protein